MGGSVVLNGSGLTPQSVAAIARGRNRVQIEPAARERIQAAADLVARAAHAGTPVYGLTTGLGSRVLQRVDGDDAAAFSLQTVRGRAMAVGEPLPAEVVRAAMAVRCNGLCAAGAVAGAAIADGLAALLNAGVHPIVPDPPEQARGDVEQAVGT